MYCYYRGIQMETSSTILVNMDTMKSINLYMSQSYFAVSWNENV